MRMMMVVAAHGPSPPPEGFGVQPPEPGCVAGRFGEPLDDGGETPGVWAERDGAFLVAMVTQLAEPGPPVAMGTVQPGWKSNILQRPKKAGICPSRGLGGQGSLGGLLPALDRGMGVSCGCWGHWGVPWPGDSHPCVPLTAVCPQMAW